MKNNNKNNNYSYYQHCALLLKGYIAQMPTKRYEKENTRSQLW